MEPVRSVYVATWLHFQIKHAEGIYIDKNEAIIYR